MDLTQLVTIFAIVATNLGTVIFLHCHLDNKTDKILAGIREEISGIHNEMKDFHEKLIKIDTEFKCFLMEERNRK